MVKLICYHRYANNPNLKYNSREKIEINTNGYTILMSEAYDLICGAIAGCVSRTSTAPLELKKLQLQCTSKLPKKLSYLSLVTELWQSNNLIYKVNRKAVQNTSHNF